MIDAINVALSAEVALEKRLATLAHNVANAGTVGFRSSEVRFEEFVKREDGQNVSMVTRGIEVLNNQSGRLEETGAAFDFAVAGDAWFAIDTPSGPALTRDGRFELNEEGFLVTVHGHAVLDAGGAPIELNPAALEFSVSSDGIIRQDGLLAGGIGLFRFEDQIGFKRFGDSAIYPNGPLEPVVDDPNVGVRQGYLETANVNAVQEITRLISVQRSFEAAASAIQVSDQSLERLITALNKV